jgi:hypothetical protein
LQAESKENIFEMLKEKLSVDKQDHVKQMLASDDRKFNFSNIEKTNLIKKTKKKLKLKIKNR